MSQLPKQKLQMSHLPNNKKKKEEPKKEEKKEEEEDVDLGAGGLFGEDF